jgi:outer membrane protein insertion porin family
LLLKSFLFAQEDYRVAGIEFVGNETFKSSRLLEQVEMYSTSGFQKTILRKTPFLYSSELLKSDIERLERFYQREGFLNAKVELKDLKVQHDNELVKIVFGISEGKPISVGALKHNFINIQVNTESRIDSVFKNAASGLKLVQGKIFRDESLESDREALAKSFGNAGYAYVEVDEGLNLSEKNKSVDITWEIDTGPLCYFGDIIIIGNEKVERPLILKQLKFEKGQTYDKALINKSQQQIFDLGMFYVVTVKAELSKINDSEIPMEILIREAPRLTTRVGIGYGNEDKFRAFVSAQQMGFLGGARR